jgi:hypothetical protein
MIDTQSKRLTHILEGIIIDCSSLRACGFSLGPPQPCTMFGEASRSRSLFAVTSIMAMEL